MLWARWYAGGSLQLCLPVFLAGTGLRSEKAEAGLTCSAIANEAFQLSALHSNSATALTPGQWVPVATSLGLGKLLMGVHACK